MNCEGLDTVAIVTLNNVEIGRAENMFRRYRFNIGAKYLGFFSPLVPSKREKNILVLLKGQTKSKRFFQADISSKKRTNEFNFTTMRLVFVRFLEEIEDTKKAFRH